MTLAEMQAIDIASVNVDQLIDIQDVMIDRNLPVEIRTARFIGQIKNPYVFRCGDMKVKVSFSANGPKLEDCIIRILNNS